MIPIRRRKLFFFLGLEVNKLLEEEFQYAENGKTREKLLENTFSPKPVKCDFCLPFSIRQTETIKVLCSSITTASNYNFFTCEPAHTNPRPRTYGWNLHTQTRRTQQYPAMVASTLALSPTIAVPTSPAIKTLLKSRLHGTSILSFKSFQTPTVKNAYAFSSSNGASKFPLLHLFIDEKMIASEG